MIHRDPFLVYTLILHHLFRDRGDDLDEERIIKSATGIRNTDVWKKRAIERRAVVWGF